MSISATTEDLGLTKTTLFVRKVPLDATNEEISEYFSQFGPLRAAFLVTGSKKDKEAAAEDEKKAAASHKGFGFVNFVDVADLQKCLGEMPQKPFRGKKQLKAEIALRKHIKEKQPAIVIKKTPQVVAKKEPAKAHRLIIRNIPFGTKEADLEKLLAPFGKTLEVTLPRVAGDGKKIRGFAFVQLASREDAAKVMQGVNGSMFRKRTLAVDWALAKDKYNEATKGTPSAAAAVPKPQGEEETEDQVEEVESMSEGESVEDVKDESVVEMEEDESAEEIEEAESDEYKKTVFVRNLPFDINEEAIKKIFTRFGAVQSIKVVKDKATGFARGCAFVQFTCASAAQKAIEAAARTANPTSDEPKPYTGDSILVDADRLETSQEGLVVEGRALFVFLALEKKAAEKLIKQRTNPDGDLTVRDKRHLYLVNEGLVRRGAPAFPHWTNEEVEFRGENVKARLRELKKDLNVTVSQVRLSIRHLPTRIEEKQLRVVFTKAVEQAKAYVASGAKPPLFDPQTAELLLKRKPRIVQVKIVRVTEKEITASEQANQYNPRKHRQEALRAGRSKGFGFVQFAEQVHAMACVRWLTNWGVPEECWQEAGMVEQAGNVKTRVKWPIVEFATEKLYIVKARTEREEKKQQQSAPAKEGEGGDRKRKRASAKGKDDKPKNASANDNVDKKRKNAAPAEKRDIKKQKKH